MRIGGIVQARMSSRRFVGKVLRSLQGKPLLKYLLESLTHCRDLQQVVVATSADKSDEPIAQFCRALGVSCFRGPLNNVAARFHEVLSSMQWDAFVRLSGDSPLLDYRLVDRALAMAGQQMFDVVTNIHPRTFPHGQSVEVVRTETFMQAYSCMHSKDDLEHVTKHFYRHADQFRIVNFQMGMDYSGLQMAVDTLDDFRRVQTILAGLKSPHWEYSLDQLIDVHFQVGQSLQGPSHLTSQTDAA